jgi:hypothetical protein
LGETTTETGELPVTVIWKAVETCPSGLVTVTGTELPAAVVEPLAVSWEEETYVVTRDAPSNFTIAPDRNAFPPIVSFMLPVCTGLGVTDEITGAGYRIATVAEPVTGGVLTVVACTFTVEPAGTAEGAE